MLNILRTLFAKKKERPPERANEGPEKPSTREYSLLQLSSPMFKCSLASSDDDQFVKQAYSLMQNARWGEARRVIHDGLQKCNRKDRLCELIANIYLNEKNPLAIGWYMQSCVLGSSSWVPYLLVSYASRGLGLDEIAWRSLNACDVIETGMKRIDKLETDIAQLVKHADRSQLLGAMKNFEKVMDPYLPSANELPHDQMERATFLLQNITGDPGMPPLKQRLRLMKRYDAETNGAESPRSPSGSAATMTPLPGKKCGLCSSIYDSTLLQCPKCGSSVVESSKTRSSVYTFNIPETKAKSEAKTEKKAAAGYTFGRGGQFVVATFTKPGDSGQQFYFFENKDLAVKMLAGMSGTIPLGGMSAPIPALKRASVVQCTLEELQLQAKRCGASIEAYFIRGDSIIMRRY